MKTINFKKKKNEAIKKQQLKSYDLQNSVIFVKKNVKVNTLKIKNFKKLEIIVIIQRNQRCCAQHM